MKDLARLLLEAAGRLLIRTDEKTWQGGTVYKMDVRKDRFVHFTPKERADQIVSSGKLLMEPPYPKFGIDAVSAVSLTYGQSVPGVQTTHVKNDLVAILFSTTVKPKHGFVEEVVWKRDVAIRNPKVISAKKAVRMLKNTPEQIESSDVVMY